MCAVRAEKATQTTPAAATMLDLSTPYVTRLPVSFVAETTLEVDIVTSAGGASGTVQAAAVIRVNVTMKVQLEEIAILRQDSVFALKG